MKFEHYKKKDKMETLLAKSIKITAVVSAYWVVSILFVFLNKYLLSNKELKLDRPIFLTWFQCSIAFGLCVILGYFSKWRPNLITFPEPHIDFKIARQVFPLSIMFVGMITFNNLCLRNVGVAFYYIGRSLTTVFNVVLTYVVLKQPTSVNAVICCGVIVGGFILGVDQEQVAGTLSIMGVIYGILASLFVSLNAIFTKKVLPFVDENIWRLILYNNFNAFWMFLPLMIFAGELNGLLSFPRFFDYTFWLLMFLSGIFGFTIGYVGSLQVQVTSPLTHNISGTAKACAQTILACMYFQEMKSVLWWLSNAVVLTGSLAYTHVRRQEMKEKHKEEMKTLSVDDQDNPEKSAA